MRATQTPMKALICSLICLATSPLLADYTFVWSGNDPRFSGTFSISDRDWANRAFTNVTAVNFQFHQPSYDDIFHSPHDEFSDRNDSGWLTADGMHLDHATNLILGFWMAAELG